MNTVCKEHEWVVRPMTITGGHTALSVVCEICGQISTDVSVTGSIAPLESFTIDFKIKENLEQINKQGWEDIENAFSRFTKRMLNPPFEEYKRWLKENYIAPQRKNKSDLI